MIGIFDSGVGGLTAVKALDVLKPDCDIVYFGDTARVPYGTKGREVITRYALQDCRFLLSKKIDAILVACGTVSSNALNVLRDSFDVPIIGVVEPASEKAFRIAENGNGLVAVLGTAATVKSKAFETEIAKHGNNIKIVSRSCPLFVPLVENGHCAVDDKLTLLAAEEYLKDIIPLKPSAVILGCTHYPLISDLLSSLLPESTLISSSEEAAKALLAHTNINIGSNGKREYYVSDDPHGFENALCTFIGRQNNSNISLINIEDY